MEFINISKQEKIATLTLNRPDKHNALHAPLIKEISESLREIKQDDTRVLIIHGAGNNFCAGGDIAWMKQIASASESENIADAALLADMLFQLYSFPKPTIALVHGAAKGGGLGLIGACDIAIGSEDANFALPEVKLGITPSIISPYVIAAIGQRQAHYYFLTGDSFSAEKAMQIGLLHAVTTREDLTNRGLTLARTLMQNSPHALHAAKHLIRYADATITAELSQETAHHLATIRTTPEAKEGLQAFLEKRKPHWVENI